MELKVKNIFGKLLVILQNYLTINYRKLPVTIPALPTLLSMSSSYYKQWVTLFEKLCISCTELLKVACVTCIVMILPPGPEHCYGTYADYQLV